MGDPAGSGTIWLRCAESLRFIGSTFFAFEVTRRHIITLFVCTELYSVSVGCRVCLPSLVAKGRPGGFCHTLLAYAALGSFACLGQGFWGTLTVAWTIYVGFTSTVWGCSWLRAVVCTPMGGPTLGWFPECFLDFLKRYTLDQVNQLYRETPWIPKHKMGIKSYTAARHCNTSSPEDVVRFQWSALTFFSTRPGWRGHFLPGWIHGHAPPTP